jgi:glycosyltransferase involved in cell wall biosynthesis
MEGLRRSLERYEPDVELIVASLGGVAHDPFSLGNARYISIAALADEPKGKTAEVLSRWKAGAPPTEEILACERIIAEHRPDLVHVHGSESFLGLALRNVSHPRVISLQGIMHAYLRHAAAGLSPADWLRVSLTRETLHGYGVVNMLRIHQRRARAELRIMELCDAYLGRTEWDRAVLRSVRPDARYYQAEEILAEVFYAQSWKDPGPDAPIFCTSGSSMFKGLETLLDALVALRTMAGTTVRLRVAGAVEHGSLWPAIKRRLADARLRGAVELLGVLQPPAILEELRRASLYVQPSHIDNSPNALCEAMLVGVPCAASFVGGIPSLVRDGETGLLFHDREPVMMSAALERLLEDRELAARLGAAARRVALDRHDPERVAHAVVRAYKEEIDRGPVFRD